MKTFRSYQLATAFYRDASKASLPRHLRDQLLRASSSICLNLGEGYGRTTQADQQRFFAIAFGSIRECQVIADLALDAFTSEQRDRLDHLAASVWKLMARNR